MAVESVSSLLRMDFLDRRRWRFRDALYNPVATGSSTGARTGGASGPLG